MVPVLCRDAVATMITLTIPREAHETLLALVAGAVEGGVADYDPGLATLARCLDLLPLTTKWDGRNDSRSPFSVPR